MNWIEPFENSFRRRYGEGALSSSFAYLASVMLAKSFHEKTGIDPLKAKSKIVLVQSPRFCRVLTNKEVGKIEAGIDVLHYGSDAIVCWKSKNGERIIPSDSEIDENNILIWFEDLAVDSIRRSWARINKKPSIDSGKYHFKIEFDTFLWEGVFFQFFLKNETDSVGIIKKSIEEFVVSWNNTSESSKRKLGVVHNIFCKKMEQNYVEYYMDLGSASHKFLDQFLLNLNDIESIEKVRITSFP